MLSQRYTRLLKSSFVILCGLTVIIGAALYLKNNSLRISQNGGFRFDLIDNVTGANTVIVPNFIHYIRWNIATITFVDYVCIRSAFLNHRPDFIYMHTNLKNFSGDFWEKLLEDPDFKKTVVIKYLDIPSEIYGQPLSKAWRLYHGSDIARMEILKKYGGIYLDNDVYVVRPLRKYLKYEMTLGWDDEQFLGNQVLISHPNARFIDAYLGTYKIYKSNLWYYNAGERPTVEVLYKNPELVHRVRLQFGVHNLAHHLYNIYWSEWRKQDCIHLLINHRSYLDKFYKDIPVFNEVNIYSYNKTFGEMARSVI
ncbi:uncharacterized protein LOC136028814 [Artemia franciscana]|uniref:Uncharacterized protein n=1 Tax=Artemia franciscana TaxID=6661 RepID=A0AA88HF47_ARTSF|nr:hypothetical protein QYM36_015570 [Artemia franciscana]